MPIYNASLQAVDPGEVRRYAGLMKARDFDQGMIDAACEEALLLAEPKGIYLVYDYDGGQGIVQAEPPFTLKGSKIGAHLQGCERVAVLAVTVGEAIEEQVTRYFQAGRYAYSLLLDAAATAAVEQAADELEKAIRPKAAARGFAMRWRYSPGYGDWPLSQQPELVRLAQAGRIGISLTEALMLCPRKSVTALIGLYPSEQAAEASPLKQGCAGCTQRGCISCQ